MRDSQNNEVSSINLNYTLILQIYIDGETAYFQFIMGKVFQSCFVFVSRWNQYDVAKKVIGSFCHFPIMFLQMNSFAFGIILKHFSVFALKIMKIIWIQLYVVAKIEKKIFNWISCESRIQCEIDLSQIFWWKSVHSVTCVASKKQAKQIRNCIKIL